MGPNSLNTPKSGPECCKNVVVWALVGPWLEKGWTALLYLQNGCKKLHKQDKSIYIKLSADQLRLLTQYWTNSMKISVTQLSK